MTNSPHTHDVARAEWEGARLTFLGKALVVAVITGYIFWAFAFPGLYWHLIFVGIFLVTTILQLWISWQYPGRLAPHIVLIVIEASALATVLAVPNPFSGFDLPDQMPFRGSYFALLLVYVMSIAYTYRSAVALTAGVSAAAAWLVLTLRVQGMPETVGWEVLGNLQDSTRQDLYNLYGNPHFFDVTGRTLEIVLMLLAAVLVAGLVWRSKSQVSRILASEKERQVAFEEKEFIRQTFGTYVPDAVVSTILADKGALAPIEREATVIFVDLEGFTALGEKVDAGTLLEVLNAWFEEAGNVIMKHGGTINQFQGDAILASFNLPVEDPNHATDAVKAGVELLRLVARDTFNGQKLAIRIGIHSGPVAAGAVGSSKRLSYTIHGTTVNTAARIEALNKTTGTRLLVSEATREIARCEEGFSACGLYPLKGVEGELAVFTVAGFEGREAAQ